MHAKKAHTPAQESKVENAVLHVIQKVVSDLDPDKRLIQGDDLLDFSPIEGIQVTVTQAFSLMAHLLMSLALFCPCKRSQDYCALTLDRLSYSQDTKQFSLTFPAGLTSKTYRSALIVIPTLLTHFVALYLRVARHAFVLASSTHCRSFFLNKTGGPRCTVRSLCEHVLRNAGVPAVCFHSFRRVQHSRTRRSGAPEDIVRAM